MNIERITIIGLGLIGGSLGMALKRANHNDIEITGCARRREVAERAIKIGAVDRTEARLEKAVVDSNIVIVATPVMSVRAVFQQIADHLPQSAIVSDVGSTKREIMEWAQQILPSTIDFVGGHPMTGKETSGIDAAEADLFSGCIYCLTPSGKAATESVNAMEHLVKSIGASPVFIDPTQHDRLVAGISHLPLLLSSALVSTLANSGHWSNMSKLAASGYRDTTRLASGNPDLHMGICKTNRQAIIEWMDRYIEQLKECRQMIAEDEEALREFFITAGQIRKDWLHNDGRRFVP